MTLFKRENDGSYWELWGRPEGGMARWANLESSISQMFNEADLKKCVIYEAVNHHDVTKVMACLKETLASGWIDREGHFWGCNFEAHDHMLGILFGNERGNAECKGWVHIHPWMWWINPAVEMTEAQEKTLLEIGRSLSDKKYYNKNVAFSDVFPDGYPLGLLPLVKLTLYRHKNDNAPAL